MFSKSIRKWQRGPDADGEREMHTAFAGLSRGARNEILKAQEHATFFIKTIKFIAVFTIRSSPGN